MRPLEFVAWGSAPADTKASTMLSCPALAADNSGVQPCAKFILSLMQTIFFLFQQQCRIFGGWYLVIGFVNCFRVNPQEESNNVQAAR